MCATVWRWDEKGGGAPVTRWGWNWLGFQVWIWLGEGVVDWHSGHSLMQPCTVACSGKEAEGEACFDACAASRATAWFESLRQQHADSSMRQRCRRAVPLSRALSSSEGSDLGPQRP